MKKLLILSCVLAFCLTLAACHTTDSADSSAPSVAPGSAIANESSAHQTESESSLEESRISQDTTVTSDPTENETTAPAKPADPMSTTEPESEKAPESTTPPQTEPETKPTEPPSESAKAYAGAEDARVVADKVLEYINSFRINRAAQLIVETQLPISEIGPRCGFTNVSNFNHLFRAHLGTTPSDYRSRFKTSPLTPDTTN